MRKCTKKTINGKEILLSDGDYVLVKLRHPIQKVREDYCYTQDDYKPEIICSHYNHPKMEGYLNVYNNGFINGYCLGEIKINGGSYPSRYYVRSKSYATPLLQGNFIATFYEEEMDHDLDIIPLGMYKDQDKTNEYLSQEIYDRCQKIKKEYNIDIKEAPKEIDNDYVYDYERQKQQELIEQHQDEADIAEARLAQIDVMHEVVEQHTERNQNTTNTIDDNNIYHGELTEQQDS